MRHRLTGNEIKLPVAAKRARWLESGATIAWKEMHAAVDASLASSSY